MVFYGGTKVLRTNWNHTRALTVKIPKGSLVLGLHCSKGFIISTQSPVQGDEWTLHAPNTRYNVYQAAAKHSKTGSEYSIIAGKTAIEMLQKGKTENRNGYQNLKKLGYLKK